MPIMSYLIRPPMQQPTLIEKKSKPSSPSQHITSSTPGARPSREIGDYWLGKTIGRGASGRVKLGIHKYTGERVAIKMITRSQLLSSSSTSRSVQRELAILQLLHHPHLVELRQVLQDTTYVYFVMEYLEGGELFHALARRGKFGEDDARLLFRQLVTALAWCHAHHICHRDLKPENILLDKDQKHLKIVDFGMATMQSPMALLKTSCGSPHYASPEIVKGKPYHGPATDVWSCGVILFALLTGRLPFDDENIGRLLSRIKTGHHRPLPDTLSLEAMDLIKRMLTIDPTQRIQMDAILHHPWLTNESFLGTDLRFPKTIQTHYATMLSPLQDKDLEGPMVHRPTDLDGRVWETLKVLWREMSQDDLLARLKTHSGNVQKLTCQLLQKRARRIQDADDTASLRASHRASIAAVLHEVTSITASSPTAAQTIRHMRRGSDDTGADSKGSLYDSSASTVSCCRTMDWPATPQSPTFEFVATMDTNDFKKRLWDRIEGTENGDQGPIGMAPGQQPPTPYHHGHFSACRRSRPTQPDPIDLVRRPTFASSTSSQSGHISGHRPSAPRWVFDRKCGLVRADRPGPLKAAPASACTTAAITSPALLVSSPPSSLQHLQPAPPTRGRSAWTRCWPFSKMTAAPPAQAWVEHAYDALTHAWRSVFAVRRSHSNHYTIQCAAKHEGEAAGKLHQVLQEHFNGQLSGRLYPNGQIVWSGSLQPCDEPSRLGFLCHFQPHSHSQATASIVLVQGDPGMLKSAIHRLLHTLNDYETDCSTVASANGWLL